MSLSSVGCTRCGSNELTEVDGFLKCVYCQSRYEVGSRQVSLPATSIGLADDVKTLLKKCEDEPANRQRYIRMILNIDPSNKEVQRFQEMGVQRRVVGLSSTAVSSKSWTVALVLSLLFGWLGVDRFYLGQVGLGIAKFLTAGGFGVWWVIDFVLIALRRAKDSDGRILR
jgi:hypothetical protein